MMKAVDHISFTVSNRERAIEFYSFLLRDDPLRLDEASSEVAARIIGYEQVDIRAAYFALPVTETVLELIEYVVPAGQTVNLENFNVGNAHLGLVVDDLQAEYERLAAAGATFTYREPVVIPSGPWQGVKAIYLRDPDGITIELLER